MIVFAGDQRGSLLLGDVPADWFFGNNFLAALRVLRAAIFDSSDHPLATQLIVFL